MALNRNIQKRICHIDSLPNDVLLEIFSYFDPVELSKHVLRVCWKWHKVGNHDSLWRKLDLGYCDEPGLEHYVALMKRHPTVMTIMCREVGIEFLDEVLTLCPNLRRLEIPNTVDVPDNTVKKLVTACPKLEWLDLSSGDQSYSVRNAFHHLASLKDLKTLKVINCPWVSSEFISMIASNCKELECLSLRSVSLPKEAIYDLLLKLKSTLKDLTFECEKLDAKMKELLHECDKLESLTIEAVHGPISMQMSHPCDHQRKLKKLGLSLWPNKQVPAGADERIFHTTIFPNVTRLVLKLVSGNNFLGEDIVSSFPQLQAVYFLSCSSLTNAGVISIVQNCVHLEKLHVTFCDHVTRDSFEQVLKTGRKSIKVMFARNISSRVENSSRRDEFVSDEFVLSPNDE